MINFLFSVENTLNNNLLGTLRHRIAQKVGRYGHLLVVCSVLFLSLALPLQLSQRYLVLVVGLVPAIVGFLMFRRWPPAGIILLIITALIVPSPNLPGGLNVAVLLLGGLIGWWMLDTMLIRRQPLLSSSRTVWPLIALIVIALLSFGFGQLPWFSFAQAAPLDAQLGGLAIFILAAGAFLLVAHQVKELHWLQWMVWVFVGLGALHTAGWLVPPIGRFTSQMFQRGTYNNSLFWVWLVTLAFSQAFINKKLAVSWRVVLFGVVAATLYVAYVLNSGWKSGYLPPLVSIAVILSLYSWRLGLLLGILGVVPAIALSSEAIATDEYSYSTRLDAWIIMLEIIKSSPLFGFGPANYYWFTPLFPIRGYAVRFNSHNQYLDIVAQIGILGLCCFIWFAWEVGWLGWRLRNRVPEGFAQAYVYGALGGLAGTLAAGVLVDWIFPFVYNIGFTGFRASMLAWLFLGGLVSIEQMAGQQKDA